MFHLYALCFITFTGCHTLIKNYETLCFCIAKELLCIYKTCSQVLVHLFLQTYSAWTLSSLSNIWAKSQVHALSAEISQMTLYNQICHSYIITRYDEVHPVYGRESSFPFTECGPWGSLSSWQKLMIFYWECKHYIP